MQLMLKADATMLGSIPGMVAEAPEQTPTAPQPWRR
jgi:hypothetical protein